MPVILPEHVTKYKPKGKWHGFIYDFLKPSGSDIFGLGPTPLMSKAPAMGGGIKYLYKHIMKSLPKKLRKGINVKSIREMEFPSEYAGEGGRLVRTGRWGSEHHVALEKGEKNLLETLRHELIHSYVLQHPEIQGKGFFGMENAVNKIMGKLKK